MTKPGTGTKFRVHVLHDINKILLRREGFFFFFFLYFFFRLFFFFFFSHANRTWPRQEPVPSAGYTSFTILQNFYCAERGSSSSFSSSSSSSSHIRTTRGHSRNRYPVPGTRPSPYNKIKLRRQGFFFVVFSSCHIRNARGHVRNWYPVPGTHPSPLKKFYSAGRGCSTSSSHIQTIRGHSRIPYPVPGTPPSPY